MDLGEHQMGDNITQNRELDGLCLVVESIASSYLWSGPAKTLTPEPDQACRANY
jgi:hypothetical protein